MQQKIQTQKLEKINKFKKKNMRKVSNLEALQITHKNSVKVHQ